jgi:hypothetical protein
MKAFKVAKRAVSWRVPVYVLLLASLLAGAVYGAIAAEVPQLAFFLFGAWKHKALAGGRVAPPDDYTLLKAVEGFDTETNSRTVLLWSNRLTAAYALERIVSSASYPRVVAIINFDDEGYYVVLGRAAVMFGVIGLSEAMFDPEDGDAREVLFTLAHEIGHLQHSAFFLDPEGMDGRSETLTQIAALEVVSGQCWLGWDLACRAAHLEIYSLYRAGVADWIERHLPRLAKPAAMWLLLGEDPARVDKWDRFWAADWQTRMEIRRKYAIDPLLYLVHNGCRSGRLVDPFFELEFDLDDVCRIL